MSNIAVQAEHLAKEYRIGKLRRHDTLRDDVMDAISSAFRRNRSASRTKETFWALRDLSFQIKQGETVGIIGPNGAGKSTLLKILSRITRPTAGFAEIRGRVASLLEVGTGFHLELTGRENIYLNGAILGMKSTEIKQKFDAIVDFSGVEKFLDTPVKRYSSGMYVRLAFAVAAHLQPDILIVDEVLSVGDLAFQRKCLGKMESVASEGRTVLFVSHNMGVVKSLCSRSLLMGNGTLQMDGSSETVVARYLAQSEQVIPTRQRARIPADLRWRNTEEREGFFLYPQGEQSEISLQCGDTIALDFDIEAPMPLSDTTIGVSIHHHTGERVTVMSSKVQNVPCAAGISQFWKVRCDMGQLPLNAGVYFANVHVGNKVTDHARFTRAFVIKIDQHDVFGWGNPLPGVDNWGYLYWVPQWNIRPVEPGPAS